MSVKEKMTAIADEIREKTKSTERFSINEMVEKIEDVYDRGKRKEYDLFWDSYQNKGERKNYAYAFCGPGWNESVFVPKYDIFVVGSADNMFSTFGYSAADNIRIPLVDLVQHLENCGVKLNCSQMTRAYRSFYNCRFSHLPELDFSNCETIANAFQHTPVETIDKLILNSKTSETTYNNPFMNCSALKNITVEGEFVCSISFQWSNLTIKSMKSIITHLKNYKGTEMEYDHTLTLSAASINLLDGEGETSPENTTWREYISSLGWNLA